MLYLGIRFKKNTPKQNNMSKKVQTQNVMEVEMNVEKRKPGRPKGSGINPDSKRQKQLALWEQFIEYGVVIKRGRPHGTVNPNSKRQQRIAELNAKKAMGGGKPGRPKMVKEVEA